MDTLRVDTQAGHSPCLAMAAAVAHQPKLSMSLSKPFQMVSRSKAPASNPGPSAAAVSPPSPPRAQPPPTSPQVPSSAYTQDSQLKTFKRIRSSLEQSVRAATRSRAKSPPLAGGEFGQNEKGTSEGELRERSPKAVAPTVG